MTNRWYVGQTEFITDVYDVAKRGLMDQGFDVYFPLFLKRRVDRRRVVHLSSLPLFPGYFFVAFDTEARDSRWRSISGTRGVAGLIQQDYAHPLPIPDGEIERLRACEGPDGYHHIEAEEEIASWLQGKEMRPLEGSLQMMIGLCKVYDPRTDRVKLLLSLFGRQFEAWLPRESVEIIS